ncbi:trichohyalin-like isoform X5 [Mya arenaria]|uniref:trichohyalin-like isoform X4 n=1 Tax=Mya arenaria TaxID=6604 RepID=UPI0022E44AE6|nr:trichohyalin-like isoform X4 [Mya arenaria]XP_052786606.1 trichohyalin-like isoform X5 [Mya arenaria]
MASGEDRGSKTEETVRARTEALKRTEETVRARTEALIRSTEALNRSTEALNRKSDDLIRKSDDLIRKSDDLRRKNKELPRDEDDLKRLEEVVLRDADDLKRFEEVVLRDADDLNRFEEVVQRDKDYLNRQILEDEKLRQEEQIKKLVDENLRLQDENSKIEERYQRLEERIEKLKDEKSRLEEIFQEVADESLRIQDENTKIEERHQRTKQLEKYCFLYYWLHSDCHVALETPARTYISIHPPHTKGFQPNQLNVVQSLKEDIKRLGNPSEIIPLVGLNGDGIDEWYKTVDVHNEQLTEDYSILETSFSKGSDDFEKYFAKHKPSKPKKNSPLYIYAAAWDHSHCATAPAKDSTLIEEIRHL